MSDHVIGLARLVADRCSVELGFDAVSTMFRAEFTPAGLSPLLVVRWGASHAVVEAQGNATEDVRDLPRLAALCDAALATL